MGLSWSFFTIVLIILSGKVMSEPDFSGEVQNLTVPVGREAIFQCTVTNLGGYKVGWVKADNKAIQAIHTHVVTHNPRVSVTHSGPHIWNLHISSVREEDAGTYMCQINTDPMKSQVAHLDITVSPDILDDETPSEVTVKEGESVRLTCKANGQPQPKITWRREDQKELTEVRFKDEKGSWQYSRSGFIEGEVIKWQAVSRHQMGAYLCIANNGVPPSVSKRIMVSVMFVPSVKVKSQLIGVPKGSKVIIECEIQSSPKPITFWTKDEVVIPLTRPMTNLFFPTSPTHVTKKIRYPKTAYIPPSTVSFESQMKNTSHSALNEANIWSRILSQDNSGSFLRPFQRIVLFACVILLILF
ncbi:lachesin-like isoform X2 [Artemia franciscana]|uniref:lachesin-like isoform X2 n=1 Tax=Artemia franciscana TaxID=6661 RepID=UPI0032DBBAEF